ncbi:MAG: hypothetical protein PUH41_05155 [Prevotella sp.]|nr:hypothetical protein [Prevotella sp.]
MKNLVKGLMLSVAIALGATTAQAQGTGTGTSTEDVKPAASTEFWMGEEAAEGMFYLYNVGAKIFVTDNTPSETDINKATLWTASVSDNSFSFTDEKGNLVITMNNLSAKITKKGYFTSATKFGLETGTTKGKGNAYKLALGQIKPHYFNVDNGKYTRAHTPGDFNDWLFISEVQKNAYTEYVDLFNKAKSYTEGDSKLTDAIVKQINDALKSYNYNTYEDGGKAKLKAAIKAAEDFITTGINEIGSTTDAKVSEIYGVNGARKSQLTKGLNIVKMSDGTVKKVLVK